MVEVVIASLVGAAVGVFLVAVAERVPYGRPLLSHPHTRREGTVGAGVRRGGLPRAALFPVVTAIVFGALAARFGLSAELPAFLYLGAIGVALAAIDLAHHRLPNTLVLPSYPVGLVLLGAAAATRGDGDAYLRALAGMAVLYGAYFLLLLAHPAGLGFGDLLTELAKVLPTDPRALRRVIDSSVLAGVCGLIGCSKVRLVVLQ